tara:strand:- start:2603 stop:2800 length:198 start_codon:yes stop_codon:yes gene_type:complete
MSYGEIIEFIIINTQQKYHKDINLKLNEIEKAKKETDFINFFNKSNQERNPYDSLVYYYINMDKK